MSEPLVETISSAPAREGDGPERFWILARSGLAARLSPGDFKTWIEPLQARTEGAGRLTLVGPNLFFLNWVRGHFLNDISAALAEVGFNPSAALEFSAAPDVQAAEAGFRPPLEPAAGGSEPDGLGLGQWRAPQPLRSGGRFTFDNFVVGESNRLAHSAAQALAAGAALGADALFLTADHGLGKSHLALALGRGVLQNRPRHQVYYLTAEDFTNEMTHALRHGLMEEFKAKYRQVCDVLVLEEIQFLAGKEKIQSELCFTLDCLLEKGKKVVFTSPQEPREIPRLSRSLRSRLAAALVSPIGAPDYETRLNILIKKARAGNSRAPRAVLEYLAERVTADVRQLESGLISLQARSQLLGRTMDLDMARETLAYLLDGGSEDEGGGLSLLSLRSLICRYFQVETAEITSRDRSAKLNEARTMGIYLARQLTARTLEEIGRTFGRSHSSALYAYNKLEQRLKKDPKLQGRLDFLRQQILAR